MGTSADEAWWKQFVNLMQEVLCAFASLIVSWLKCHCFSYMPIILFQKTLVWKTVMFTLCGFWSTLYGLTDGLFFIKIFICVLLRKGCHISGITKESVNYNRILHKCWEWKFCQIFTCDLFRPVPKYGRRSEWNANSLSDSNSTLLCNNSSSALATNIHLFQKYIKNGIHISMEYLHQIIWITIFYDEEYEYVNVFMYCIKVSWWYNCSVNCWTVHN